MARARTIQHSFTSGELDPDLRGRADIKHYHSGARKMRNVLARPHGGFSRRWGTRWRATIPEVSPGVKSNTVMIDFQFSTTQLYLILIHHQTARIYKDGVEQATVVLPYTSDDIPGLSWTQDLDTLLLFHKDHQTRALQRQGSDTSWAVSGWTFKNLPRFAFGDTVYTNGVDHVYNMEFVSGWANEDDGFKIIIGEDETDPILYSSTGSTMAARLQAALRAMGSTSADGITVENVSGNKHTITFSGDDGQRPWSEVDWELQGTATSRIANLTSTTTGEFPGEDIWSDTRGWPRCGTFFQGRLYAGGSTQRPQTLLGSRVNDPNDFNDKKTFDDFGINATAASNDVSAIYAIVPGRHLQIFTSSGEFYVPSSDVDPITPKNMALRRTTKRGTHEGVRVHDIDGASVFPNRTRSGYHEFLFTDVEAAYTANNISLLASHLIRSPLTSAYRAAVTSDDANYLFSINNDGTISAFCSLRSQNVNAHTLLETDGLFTDVAVLLDEVYVVTERTVNGETVKFLEQADDAMRVDCGLQATVGSDTASLTVGHLPLRQMDVILDDIIQAPLTANVDGLITFAQPAESSYQAGLAWPDVTEDLALGWGWYVETLPPAIELRDANTLGQKSKTDRVEILLQDTTGLIINDNEVEFREFGDDLLDQPVAPYTGWKEENGFLGWDIEQTLKMGDSVPSKTTVLAVAQRIGV